MARRQLLATTKQSTRAKGSGGGEAVSDDLVRGGEGGENGLLVRTQAKERREEFSLEDALIGGGMVAVLALGGQ